MTSAEAREHARADSATTEAAWRALLTPDSVAILGLSGDGEKHGARVLRHLRASGFGGNVWGVNPRGAPVDGVPVVPSLTESPSVPDVVVCAIPAAGVRQAIETAGALGARAAIVFSSGFAETGADGRRAQEELALAAQTSGIRILGPNSGGVIHPACGRVLSFLTCLDRPAAEIRTGQVGIVSQSGGTASLLHNLAAQHGGGLAVSICTGNEVDLTVSDGITALADHPEVRAVAVVLETVRYGRAFIDSVQYAHALGKPVVICRLGTSDAAERLARGHTGALASAPRIVDGVCGALGVTVVRTPGELLEVAELLARSPVPAGERVGVVTHSGGTAILLTDLFADEGLRLPPPPQQLVTDMAGFVDHGNPTNPLDLGAIISGPHRFADATRRFAESGAYDVVLAASTPHPPSQSERRAEQLSVLHGGDIPVFQLWLAGDLGLSGLRLLRDNGVPVTDDPRAAVRAVAGLLELAAAGRDTEPPTGMPAGRLGTATPTEHAVKDLLRRWGLPVVDGALANDVDEARGHAARIGLPVVVKASSPDVPHKAAAGGVRLDLRSLDEVGDAVADVRRAMAAAHPEARVDGCLVERYRPGPEMIVGCLVDETFGPVVLAGPGGVDAEALADVTFAPAPSSDAGALRLLRRLSHVSALTRSRLVPVPAVEQLARLVGRFSRGFAAHHELLELEVNPVTWSGSGWTVVDALARLQDPA